ncbi:AhpC/TSA family protein [Candidatus Leptofilum sp.]|uniref:AhpC/TSA family protein n=1 Tax=Candidatus Leptofilum sp. TaxID=3241576 RepID=UPI003B5C19CA
MPCRDHVAQVVAHQEQFEAANVQIATISFGTNYWSNVWLQETQSPFSFLVDQQLAAYQAYGLKSSAIRAWSPRSVLYYTRAKLQGRETLGNRGDTHQLGGDFVVGGNGRLLLAHPSSDPVDRPSLDQLLEVSLKNFDAKMQRGKG